MTQPKNRRQDIFTKNRAEELGYDVWQHFVIPPFFNDLDLKTARKPRVIIGGRGCGKTMLLRYFSHQSTFSSKRLDFPEDAISHVGLYWRADTQFCNAMIKREIPDDTWTSAFGHFVALILSREIINSLKSIAKSNYRFFNEKDLSHINVNRLSVFNAAFNGNLDDFYLTLDEMLSEFEIWINNVKKKEEPIFLPGVSFIKKFIDVLKEENNNLENANYFVYIDEYENLAFYQKKIINTWLKHSEMPLIFNLALKKNAFDNRETTGIESLSEIHDYRQYDLEQYIENNFQIFAAEILFLNLYFVGHADIPINVDDLRDPSKLPSRLTPQYSKKILNYAQNILPDLKQRELAKIVLEEPSLQSRLKDRIQAGLRLHQTDLKYEVFFKKNLPEATIVIPSLLHRKKLSPNVILDNLNKLEKGKENNFSGSTNWIHNNFIGSLLQLYAPFSRPCPFYAGFKTFCYLSRGNLRHFLELCHKSIIRSINNDDTFNFPINPIKQAEAARHASTAFLGEVKSFGPYGNRLHTFVLRLGSLFGLAHRRPSLSESEQSHFTIRTGSDVLTEDDLKFIKEATKWSVLFEHEETKKKEEYQPQSVEYVLNPIYSPYFYISYRKKRKLELDTHEFIVLIKGDLDEFTRLMKNYRTKWEIELKEERLPLFSILDREIS